MKDKKQKKVKNKNNKEIVIEKKSASKKSSNKEKNLEMLEKTNSFDIIIDEERLKDKESLDFSFIENKKKKNKARKEIEIVDKDYKKEFEKKVVSKEKSKVADGISTFFMVLLAFVLGFLICFIWAKESDYFSVLETNTISEYYMVDDNYVFFGNSVVAQYDLDKYYNGLPVVNGGVDSEKISGLIDYMDENIYVYNPSRVFLLFDVNVSEIDTFINDVEEIILDIKSKRSYSKIYISSVLGNFDGVSDESIKKVNSDLEKLCQKYDIYFINILNNKNDVDEFSDQFYEDITTEIMKQLEE